MPEHTDAATEVYNNVATPENETLSNQETAENCGTTCCDEQNEESGVSGESEGSGDSNDDAAMEGETD